VYHFDRRTPKTPDGSNHGEEISFVFGNPAPAILAGPSQPGDEKLSELMSSYWINFARSGDPNGAGLPAWPAFSEKDQKAMFFDDSSSARAVPNIDKLMALDRYYAWRREQAKEKARPTN